MLVLLTPPSTPSSSFGLLAAPSPVFFSCLLIPRRTSSPESWNLTVTERPLTAITPMMAAHFLPPRLLEWFYRQSQDHLVKCSNTKATEGISNPVHQKVLRALHLPVSCPYLEDPSYWNIMMIPNQTREFYEKLTTSPTCYLYQPCMREA